MEKVVDNNTKSHLQSVHNAYLQIISAAGLFSITKTVMTANSTSFMIRRALSTSTERVRYSKELQEEESSRTVIFKIPKYHVYIWWLGN